MNEPQVIVSLAEVIALVRHNVGHYAFMARTQTLDLRYFMGCLLDSIFTPHTQSKLGDSAATLALIRATDLPAEIANRIVHEAWQGVLDAITPHVPNLTAQYRYEWLSNHGDLLITPP